MSYTISHPTLSTFAGFTSDHATRWVPTSTDPDAVRYADLASVVAAIRTVWATQPLAYVRGVQPSLYLERKPRAVLEVLQERAVRALMYEQRCHDRAVASWIKEQER